MYFYMILTWLGCLCYENPKQDFIFVLNISIFKAALRNKVQLVGSLANKLVFVLKGDLGKTSSPITNKI